MQSDVAPLSEGKNENRNRTHFLVFLRILLRGLSFSE